MSRKARRAVKKYGLTLLSILILLLVTVCIIGAVRHFGGGDERVENTDTSGQNTVTDTVVNTDTETTAGTQSTPTDTQPSTQTDSHISISTGGETSDKTNVPTTFDFSAWNLILLNPENKLPEDFQTNLKKFSYNGTSGYVDARCHDAFEAMFAAAKKDGITLTVRSAYRNITTQTTNFNNKVQEYKDMGYSDEDAYATAATIIAVPGTSEHHTGLAMDILTPSYTRLNEGFEKTEAAQWLFEHCAEYGFILRYPKDKTEITQIIYEPWHYRYVGKEAAQIIMNEGICYEEFVAKYGNS